MKNSSPIILCLSLAALIALAPATAPAGPLDPPAGPVTSTHKTLSELEPRIPISAANTPGDADSLYKITQPGSYYLTSNLTGVPAKHGIEIAAPGVTLDLGGFSLSGVANSLTGITTDGAHPDITIRSGVITGWGEHGIDLSRNGSGTGSLIENIQASVNAASGIRTNNHSVVRSCIAADNGSIGITAALNSVLESCNVVNSGSIGLSGGNGSSVRGCTVQGSAGVGISAGSGSSISDSAATGNQTGIRVGESSVITNCTASSNSGIGIWLLVGGSVSGSAAYSNGNDGFLLDSASATDCRSHNNEGSGFRCTFASTVSHCAARNNTLHGINVVGDSSVLHCTCRSNGFGGSGAGILLTSSDNRIEANQCMENDWGISTTAAGNFIARNICSGNTTLNWDIAANNVCFVVSATTAAAISGNSGGASPGSTNPNANYTY